MKKTLYSRSPRLAALATGQPNQGRIGPLSDEVNWTDDILTRQASGGFSVDASVHIPAWDRKLGSNACWQPDRPSPLEILGERISFPIETLGE